MVIAVSLAGCAPHAEAPQEIAVQGADYAFVGVPDSLSAGPAHFSYQNIGKHRHEMGIDRLVQGRTFKDVMEGKLPDDSLYGPPVGILVTKPGEKAEGKIFVDLAPGATYLIWCDFRDSTGAKKHSEMGMIAAFTVR